MVRTMTTLNDIFDIKYGNQLDLNKMKLSKPTNKDKINFISRTSKNSGVVDIIKSIPNVEPLKEGLITVALGGSMLSSFVQQKPFYTAQNIMVLESRKAMSFQEKVFYCICIRKNKFRYSTFGREANKTLNDLEVPERAPSWVNDKKLLKELKEDIISIVSKMLP